MNHIVFICSANLQRSKTAEDYFAQTNTNFLFSSAGTNITYCQKVGSNPITHELLEEADLIVVMEHKHQKQIKSLYGHTFSSKIKVLNIPDRYKYYQKELIELLEERVAPYFTILP